MKKARYELADVLTYLLNFAELAEIDITEAFFEKLDYTDKKYPVDKVNQDLQTYHKIKQAYREKSQN